MIELLRLPERGADATRESPGTGRAGGPGDLGLGCGWPNPQHIVYIFTIELWQLAILG
jgi:hypothetical protein